MNKNICIKTTSGNWKIISSRHVKEVFEKDRGRRDLGAQLLGRLKAYHFCPCSYEKMRVNVATAMINSDTVFALEQEGIGDAYEGTIEYIKVCCRFRKFFTETIISAETAGKIIDLKFDVTKLVAII